MYICSSPLWGNFTGKRTRCRRTSRLIPHHLHSHPEEAEMDVSCSQTLRNCLPQMSHRCLASGTPFLWAPPTSSQGHPPRPGGCGQWPESTSAQACCRSASTGHWAWAHPSPSDTHKRPTESNSPLCRESSAALSRAWCCSPSQEDFLKCSNLCSVLSSEPTRRLSQQLTTGWTKAKHSPAGVPSSAQPSGDPRRGAGPHPRH